MVETDTITAWIPFDGSTHATGCMGYVPGSARGRAARFVNIFKPDDAIEILKIPQIRDTPPVYVQELPRSGVAFTHGLTRARGESEQRVADASRAHDDLFS